MLLPAIFHISCGELTQDLTPFVIELRSEHKVMSSNFESELAQRTFNHLNNVFSEHSGDNNFDRMTLEIKAYSKAETVKEDERSLLRRRARELNSPSYSLYASFIGHITLRDSELESKLLLDIQISAFVGQSKLDYLHDIRLSSDEFLSETNNVILMLNEDLIEKEGNISKKPSFTIVLISLVAGVFFIGSGIALFYFLRRRTMNPKNEIQKAMTTSIGSASLSGDSVQSNDTTKVSQNEFPNTNTISTLTKLGIASRSVKSVDTIDVNGSIDMIAWKNKISTGNQAPFETDITIISQHSPNKTLEVEDKFLSKPNRQLSKKKSQIVQKSRAKEQYLTKESLKKHSKKNPFTEHSVRYHDRVYGKKRSSRTYHSINSRRSRSNETEL